MKKRVAIYATAGITFNEIKIQRSITYNIRSASGSSPDTGMGDRTTFNPS
jgi:hypothetical protein